MNENAIGHGRVLLLQTISKKDLSRNTDWEISMIIKNSQEKDKIAKEIRELIEATETEEELLKSLKKKYPTMI